MPLLGKLDPRGHPRVECVIFGPFGNRRVAAVVDTGFTGAFSLPASVAQALGLQRWNVRPTVLADGTLKNVTIYLLEVEWHGRQVTAEAWETAGQDATVGAGLLNGHLLVIDYGTARTVEIR